ncbi:MAG: TrkA family potassium uptake protein [Arcobacteraceae bacterium]|jgi:trk system potassium uptake protein TrkA|nr:TrkA family potassium uptake protein [Arcobacteraceae bacterium]
MKTIAVVGLGKFGFYIAKNLSRQNYKVIAVDTNEQRVQEISEYLENAYILDSTNKSALEDAGIVNLDTVIVSIGENIEASILTVMALKDLGNDNIIAKAITTIHGEILAKIGVSKVIHPEKVAGRMLLHNLVDHMTVEKIDLSNSMRILKLKLPDKYISTSLTHIIDLMDNVKLIAYKTDSNWTININQNHIIKKDDLFTFLGDSKVIEDFYSKLTI